MPETRGSLEMVWVAACKVEGPVCSGFEYAAALTDLTHLSNLAIHLGGTIDWDAAKREATNRPEAGAIIRCPPPHGMGTGISPGALAKLHICCNTSPIFHDMIATPPTSSMWTTSCPMCRYSPQISQPISYSVAGAIRQASSATARPNPPARHGWAGRRHGIPPN